MKQIKPKIPLFPHQLKFVNSTHRHTALVGGFGSGKTMATICRANKLIKQRNNSGLIIYVSPTYQLAEDVNIPDFEEFYDNYKVRYRVKRAEHKILLTSKDYKGEIWFRSGDKPERIVGFNATDFIIDEFDLLRKKQQDILWRKLIARIRKCQDATGNIATTPEGFKKTYELCEEQKLCHKIEADTRDNVTLPDDYIKDLESQYDDILIDQYLKGRFVNIKGHRAYYRFDRTINVIPKEEINSNTIFVGLDFNVDPMTAVLAVFNKNMIIVFDELYLRNSNTDNIASLLRERFPKDKYNVIICPDMTGIARKTSAAGRTDIGILRAAGFEVRGQFNPFVRDRINNVNRLCYHERLLIMEHCEYLIKDLEQVILDQYSSLDKENKDLTHISDALGYLCWRLLPIKL